MIFGIIFFGIVALILFLSLWIGPMIIDIWILRNPEVKEKFDEYKTKGLI